MLPIRHFVAASSFLFLLSPAVMPATAQSDSADTVSVDQAAESQIRNQLRRYVEAFNARDFDTLAELLSPQLLYQDRSSGERINDAAKLIERLQRAIETEPTLKLEAQLTDLQMQGETKALVRGSTTLKADNVPDETSPFTVSMTTQKDDWKISAIIDHDAGQLSSSDREGTGIDSLGWLVGTWEDSSPRKLRSDFRFLPGRKFLRRTLTDPSSEDVLNIEIIGYDPQRNRVRSWMYFTDGSFGSGDWSGEQDYWQLKMIQTLSDGRTGSATYVIRPLDENTMAVKMISREIGGEPRPSSEVITLKRLDSDSKNSTANKPADGAE